MLNELQPFAISFLMGFIIGLEREHSHPKGMQVIGVRTFASIALLGTVAAWLQRPYLSAVIAAFALSAILLSYIRTTAQGKNNADYGITTEFAAGIVFCLGYIVFIKPNVAIFIAAILLFILISRRTLHHFARHKLHDNEIVAFTVLAIIGLVILPFLPNQAIDPWSLINPQRLGLLILVLASVQFIGYIGVRLFGNRIGMLVGGFLGGLASSTAVYAEVSRSAKQAPTQYLSFCLPAQAAVTASLVELLLIVFVASQQLFAMIVWPVVTMVAISALAALSILLIDEKNLQLKTLPNPLDLLSVFKLALFILVLFMLVALAKHVFSIYGLSVVSFLGGLFELHGVSLVTASLFASAKLTLHDAMLALKLAIFASICSKIFITVTLSRNRFALVNTLLLVCMLIGGALAS